LSPQPIRLHLAGEAKCIRKATSELGVVVEVGEAEVLSVGVGEGGGKTDFAECEVGRDGRKAAMREGREALGRGLSSIDWVHEEQPPIFFVHGDADPQVAITQSERFLKRWHEGGTVCELVIRRGRLRWLAGDAAGHRAHGGMV
jgi:hypothetical protein